MATAALAREASRAVEWRECIEAELLLLKGSDVNKPVDDTGMTKTMIACRDGNEVRVRALLEAKADVERVDSKKWTALMHGARNGHALCVRALLEAKAEADRAGPKAWTALMFACSNGHASWLGLEPMHCAGARVLVYREGSCTGRHSAHALYSLRARWWSTRSRTERTRSSWRARVAMSSACTSCSAA